MMALWVLPHIMWCIQGTGIFFLEMLKTISRPLISGLVAAVVAIATQFLSGDWLSPLFRLILECAVMFVCYLYILFYIMKQKEFYLDIFKGLKGK